MADAVRIDLPPTREALARLEAGDAVLLFGDAYTARDATHACLIKELDRDGRLPYGLDGQVLFYAGPTPATEDRLVGSVGPTTAKRMDVWTPRLLDAGIAATIGKGARGAEVRDACARNGAVYFAAVGGAAALLATHIAEAELVAYPALGTEALVRMRLDAFPAFVAIDARGGDLYASAPEEWRRLWQEIS